MFVDSVTELVADYAFGAFGEQVYKSFGELLRVFVSASTDPATISGDLEKEYSFNAVETFFNMFPNNQTINDLKEEVEKLNQLAQELNDELVIVEKQLETARNKYKRLTKRFITWISAAIKKEARYRRTSNNALARHYAYSRARTFFKSLL